MLDRVRGYSDAVLEELSPKDLERSAEELSAFVDLLSTSGDLRTVLVDTSITQAARRSIVSELAKGKVSPATGQLLTYAVQNGVAANYFEDVKGMAAAASAKREGKLLLEGPVGRTAAGERLDGYATFVLAHLNERQLGGVEDELFRFMRIVEGNDELRLVLTTNDLPAGRRSLVVEGLLDGRASRETSRLASYVVHAGRPRDYIVLLEGLVERVGKEANRRVADVRVAAEMTASQRERLAAVLARLAGYPVDVRVTAQPNLLGGFVATVGDLVVDASLRHRLDRARGAFLAPTVHRPGGQGTGGDGGGQPPAGN